MNIFLYKKFLISYGELYYQFWLFTAFTKSKVVVRFPSRIICQILICPVDDLEEYIVSTGIRVRQQAHFVLMFFDQFF